MAIKRTIIKALDRTGGRELLAALATRYARTLTGRDVSVRYDDVWVRGLDSQVFLPDSATFRYSRKDFSTFPDRVKRILESTRDFWFYLYEPRHGDVIIDVGAGVGHDTLSFSRSVGPSGRVIAIEAHPRTFRRLEKLCEVNRLANTTCLQLAVIDDTRTVYIEDRPQHLANSVGLQPSDGHVLRVEGRSLDEICRQQRVERVDLLKMNIEGAERLAIQGMSETTGRTAYVCIACHDFLSDDVNSGWFSTRETVIDFLRRNGFRIVTRPDDPRPYVRDHVHAVREPGVRAD
jgi:FkbM family methyltransferase